MIKIKPGRPRFTQAEFDQRRTEAMRRAELAGWAAAPQPPKKKITIKMPPIVQEPDPPGRLCVTCQQMSKGWEFSEGAHDICFSCRELGARRVGGHQHLELRDIQRIQSIRVLAGVLKNGGKTPSTGRRSGVKTLSSDGRRACEH